MADTINENKVEAKPVEEVKAEPAKTEEVKTETTAKAKDKKENKKKRRPFKVVMKTWSKGLSKEASRIAWEKKRDVLKDFVTILLICVILGAIFFGIDAIVVTLQNIGAK